MQSQNGSHAASSTLSLAELGLGEKARILSVHGDPDAPARRRLQELGLSPGTPISVCHRAPLGDPRAYGVRGTHICLRRSEAKLVQVELLESAG